MKETEISILHEAFANSFQELCDFYTKESTNLLDEAREGLQPIAAASVGFSAEGIRGSAVLLTEAKTAPGIGGPDDADFGDWLGELGNQIVGRFKNKVSEYGVLINIGLPVTMKGEDLHLGDGGVKRWSVKWSDNYMDAALKMQVENTLELKHDPNLATAEEGSLCMF